MSVQILLLRKWLKDRRGRLPLLAEIIERDASKLYQMINNDRLPPHLFKVINHKMPQIEALESECLKYFPNFRRFIRKGGGRVRDLCGALRERGVSVTRHDIHSLASAKGDSRLRILKYGLQTLKDSVKQVENERRRYVTGTDKLKLLITGNVRRRNYDIRGIERIATELKSHADMGNQSAAVIFRRLNDSNLKIVTCGVDSYNEDMCKSHICQTSNQHLHAPMAAALGLRKRIDSEVHSLEIFSQITPCVNCCRRLVDSGITAVYALFEADEPGSAEYLREHSIPLFKLDLKTNIYAQVN